MVYNGIEYGDMQIICEIYHLMREHLKLSNDEMHQIFARWNKGILDSYLIEITSNILGYKDENGEYVLDKILDTAGQKGTGKWTGIEALDEGIPLTLVVEAVLARSLSSQKNTRVKASTLFGNEIKPFTGNKERFIEHLEKALYAAKIISYAQGFTLMRASGETKGWDLNYGNIALMWRGGCIIRSAFLGKIKEAFDKNPQLENLLMDDYFQGEIKDAIESLRLVCSDGQSAGVPLPCISSALSYFDGFRMDRLPANLLQAQRDYFGAHTYERVDRPRGEVFHTNWTREGGTTSASTYSV
jgi:6-phosphogluconate dehydrogenase